MTTYWCIYCGYSTSTKSKITKSGKCLNCGNKSGILINKSNLTKNHKHKFNMLKLHQCKVGKKYATLVVECAPCGYVETRKYKRVEDK